MGNLNRIQFGIGPSASEKKRTQKTGSISFLNIFFMKWIQILLIIIMKWIQCWKPLICIVFSVVLYPIIYLYSWSSFLTMWTYLISCVNCSPKIKDCPFCRQFIKGKVKTYMSVKNEFRWLNKNCVMWGLPVLWFQNTGAYSFFRFIKLDPFHYLLFIELEPFPFLTLDPIPYWILFMAFLWNCTISLNFTALCTLGFEVDSNKMKRTYKINKKLANWKQNHFLQ